MVPNSLLVGLTCAGDCLSLDGPGYCARLSLGRAYRCASDCLSLDSHVNCAGTVEVDTLDLPPVVSADTVAW